MVYREPYGNGYSIFSNGHPFYRTVSIVRPIICRGSVIEGDDNTEHVYLGVSVVRLTVYNVYLFRGSCGS